MTTLAHPTPERGRLTLSEVAADSRTMAVRQLRKILRRPSYVVYLFVQPVMDDVRAAGQLPQAATAGQLRQQVAFRAGQPERAGRRAELVGLLPIRDAGGAIGQKPRCDRAGLGVGVADRVQVGEPVQHHQVGDAVGAGELPLLLHPAPQRQRAHQPPGLVVDHPAFRRRSGECALQPTGRAGGRHRQGVVVGPERGQVQHHHRGIGVQVVGAGGVEHARQVPAHQAPQPVHQVPSVGQPVLERHAVAAGRLRVRGGQGVDDVPNRRTVRRADGLHQRGVQGALFGGGQVPVQRHRGDRCQEP